MEIVESAWVEQQEFNVGLLCYSAGSLKILDYFRTKSPVPGARADSFKADTTVVVPPKHFSDMAAIVKVAEWLQERLGVEYLLLHRKKCRSC